VFGKPSEELEVWIGPHVEQKHSSYWKENWQRRNRMSKDDRWKQLLQLVGAEGNEYLVRSGISDPIAATLSSLVGKTQLSTMQAPPLGDFRALISVDYGTSRNADADQSQLLRDNLVQLSKQLFDLRQACEKQTLSIDNNTVVTQDNTTVRGQNSLTGTAAGIGRTLSGIGTGLTLSPLIKGLASLFKGGTSNGDSFPMSMYVPPAPIRVDGANNRQGKTIEEVSYGWAGLPRRSGGQHETSFPPITIQVNTIDSRSFLDHSEGIARAVREAMLNMHAINDVVAEL